MAKVAVFIADGSEEAEAITPVDLLRRAKVDVDVISVMPTLEIEASRNVKITADKLISDIIFDDYDLLVLPGGVRGTNNLNACEELKKNLVRFNDQGKGIAAICAAPTVFAG
ncbi:MAG: DJ-1/PfpI family protein, partial [Lachnospiraceae bacterium]|nr:DJ-1/PfpI family protein [Lachnospiraceae bacterium]